MRAFVTGGAGFIGSNLVKYLCDQGHKVTVLDDLSFGFRNLIDKRAHFFKGSIANRRLLDKILPGHDVVFHLAATATITFSMKNPAYYFENNFMNGIVLLEAMRAAGIRKIVYSSSGAAYGQPKNPLVKEDSPKEPINPYGASKLTFEYALSAYHHSFGFDAIALRYFNVYGPNDEQKKSSRAVSNWIKWVLAGKTVQIYWNAEQIRDYVYVEDVARANLLAAQKGRGFRVYNVGNGRGVVMRSILVKLKKILGKEFKIHDLGERPGDPHAAVADTSRIKKELGWKPVVDLDAGLKRTVDYYINK